MTDKSQPLSGAAPAPTFNVKCMSCLTETFFYGPTPPESLKCHGCGKTIFPFPAAPVAVPAEPRKVAIVGVGKDAIGHVVRAIQEQTERAVQENKRIADAPAPPPPPLGADEEFPLQDLRDKFHDNE